MPDIAIDPEVLRQRRMKRSAIAGIAAAVLAALADWALARPAAGPSVRRSDVWIATVERGPLPIVVSAAGAFRPIEQRWITAASPGVVEQVRVLPGDRVGPDTVLAVLANPDVDSRLAQAKANLASAEAGRASLHAQLISQMLTVEGQLATDQARAETASVKERAERSVVAGMPGVVQDVAVHAGQTLPVGGGIARVASVRSLKATLQVPASEAGEVAIGQSVSLHLANREGAPGAVAIVRVPAGT